MSETFLVPTSWAQLNRKERLRIWPIERPHFPEQVQRIAWSGSGTDWESLEDSSFFSLAADEEKTLKAEGWRLHRLAASERFDTSGRYLLPTWRGDPPRPNFRSSPRSRPMGDAGADQGERGDA